MLGRARDDVAERAALLDVPDAPSSSRVADVGVDVDRRARAGHQHPSASRVFRSRMLGFACAFVLVACASRVGNAPLRLRPPIEKRTARTVKEYGHEGELHLLRWTSAGGFEAVELGQSTDGVKQRAVEAVKVMIETIKRYYPHRLEDGRNPFELLFEVSDKPSTHCVSAQAKCATRAWAPIYAFGSVPKNVEHVLPTMIHAPLVPLASCYTENIATYNVSMSGLDAETTSCPFLNYPTKKYSELAKCDPDGDVSGQAACTPYAHGLFSLDAVEDKSLYEWNSLVNKVFWRGSDYAFLTPSYPDFASTSENFLPWLMEEANKMKAMKMLLRNSDVGPRFRAVLMSKLHPELIDAKFFNWKNQSSERDKMAAELGIDATERLTEEALGKYKYHLDLGGGGGTTWSGLIPKLTMPGVLLHHETSMKDSYFDTLKPWVHYVPVAEDLHDLAERVRWLETHPTAAQRISANANDWVRDFRRLRSLLAYNYRLLAVPLSLSLDAKPLPLFAPSASVQATKSEAEAIDADLASPQHRAAVAAAGASRRRRASARPAARDTPRAPSL